MISRQIHAVNNKTKEILISHLSYQKPLLTVWVTAEETQGGERIMSESNAGYYS